MTFRQGIAVAIIQGLATIAVASIVFAHTWGKAEQKLVDLTAYSKENRDRIQYMERQ